MLILTKSLTIVAARLTQSFTKHFTTLTSQAKLNDVSHTKKNRVAQAHHKTFALSTSSNIREMTESILPKEQHTKKFVVFLYCVCVCRIRLRFSFLRGCQSRKSSPRCFDKLLGIQCTHVKCQCRRFMYIFEIVVFVCAFVLDCERHCFKCSKLNVSCFFVWL